MEQPNPNAVPGRFVYWGMVAIGTMLVVCLVLYIILPSLEFVTAPPPPLHYLGPLREKAIHGNVESAERLSTLGKEACPVMLEVLEQSDNEEVKIRCIQGLGANKYFDSVPALLKIYAADDDRLTLRHQAYMALTRFLSDPIPLPNDPAERREMFRQMMGEWEGIKKNKEAKAAGSGK